MSSKSNREEEIDESFVIASVKRDKPTVREQPDDVGAPVPSSVMEQPTGETSAIKRTREYEAMFLHKPTVALAVRSGKAIYIRREHHARISQIVSVIGTDDLSISEYVDNVLSNHFSAFGNEITRTFRKKMIFK
jgi:hypothetical protein